MAAAVEGGGAGAGGTGEVVEGGLEERRKRGVVEGGVEGVRELSG